MLCIVDDLMFTNIFKISLQCTYLLYQYENASTLKGIHTYYLCAYAYGMTVHQEDKREEDMQLSV